MLLVPTYVSTSSIHGLGLFAAKPLAKGTPIWRFDPLLDRAFPEELLEALPADAQRFLRVYAYPNLHAGGLWFFDGDDGRFMNHSDRANTDNSETPSFAVRDIAEGEELTADYRQFVLGFTGFA